MFYTKKKRKSESILNEQSKNIKNKIKILDEMKNQVYDLEKFISYKSFDDIGRLLNKGWSLKKKMNKSISNSVIDQFYKSSLKKGAIGGKILGAGNGGFMLIYINKRNKDNFLKINNKFELIKFKIDTNGTEIIHMDNGL